MSKVILYIAASVDGFIARPDGSVNWLKEVEVEGEDYGYNEFYNSVDALIMGRKTYEVVTGFGEWIYAGKPSFILSKTKLKPVHEDIALTEELPASLLKSLEAEGHTNIWLVGGGELASSMIEQGLVDEMIISIIPIELEDGIPLFTCSEEKLNEFELVGSKSFDSNLVQHFYKKKSDF